MKKLLIVEDDKQFRNSLEVVLKKHFEIDTAGTQDEALRLLSENKYCAVSTDGAFPEGGGVFVGDETLSDSDYRGNTIAKLAKEQGSYVLGLSMEPERLTEPHETFHKGEVNLLDYVNKLKENV